MNFFRNKIMIIVLFLLVLNTSVYATKTLINQKSIISGNTITVNNWSFLVEKSISGDEMIITLENDTYTLMEELCFNTGNAEICYDDNESGSYMLVSSYSLYSELTVEEDISDSRIFIGEPVQINISITNDDDHDAKNVTYANTIPEGFMVECTRNCEFIENEVRWQNIIGKEDAEYLEYYLTPIKTGSSYMQPSFSYFNGIENKKVSLDPINITVNPFFNFTKNLTKRELKIGEYADFFVNITCLNNTTMRTDFELMHTDAIHAAENIRPYSDNTHSWSEATSVNNSDWRYIRFRAVKNGTGHINASALLRYSSDIEHLIRWNYNLTVHESGAKIYTNQINDMAEGEEQQLYFYFSNPNDYMKIYNISTKVDSTLPYIFDRHYNILNGSERIAFIDHHFTPPLVHKPKVFWFNTTLNYTTEFGRSVQKEFVKSIIVYPKDYLNKSTTSTTTTTTTTSTTTTTLVIPPEDNSWWWLRYVLFMVLLIILVDIILQKKVKRDNRRFLQQEQENSEEPSERKGGFMQSGFPALMRRLRNMKKK